MLLQAAIDGASKGISLGEAIIYTEKIYRSTDIIEVGTSFIQRYGMVAVEEMRRAFPDKIILGDMKLMDGGGPSTQMCCEAGADIVTVLGVSDGITISEAVKAAHLLGKEIMVDMICVERLEKRIKEVEAIGVDYVCVHIGVDMQKQGKNPLEELKAAKRVATAVKVAVAGGINLDSIDVIALEKPDVIIVGGGFKTENPGKTAEHIRARMEGIQSGNAL